MLLFAEKHTALLTFGTILLLLLSAIILVRSNRKKDNLKKCGDKFPIDTINDIDK